MCERRAIKLLMLLAILILLNTCELQSNKAGNGLALRVNVPASISAHRIAAIATNARDIGGPSGANVQVTILTGTGAPWDSSEPISTSGKTSVDFTFPLPPPGAYQASAQLLDATGTVLDQAGPTSFTVPPQTNPVVLTIPGANLYTMVFTSSSSVDQLSNPTTGNPVTFSPIIYTYEILYPGAPVTLTLTTVSPNATITSVTENIVSVGTFVDSPTDSVYTLSWGGGDPDTVTIVVTGQNGATQTYTINIVQPS